MDTQLQNFWKESINKEAALRFSWHLRYSRQFSNSERKVTKSASAGTKSRQPDGKKRAIRHSSVPNGNTVAERIRRLENDKQRRDATTEKKEKAKSAVNDPRLTQSDGARPISLRDMRPPTTGTRRLLYNGISAHGDGRYAYLKKRKTLTPEEKYDFPILSSCQYGWKIRDFGQAKSSPHARVCVIKDSFYRNSGIILG